jgi:hypothetical protein
VKNPVPDLYSMERCAFLRMANGTIADDEGSHYVCRTNEYGDNQW